MISIIRDVISGEADFIYLIVYLGATAFVVTVSNSSGVSM